MKKELPVEDKARKIREMKRLYKRSTSKYQKRDLLKGINRLQKELNIERSKLNGQ